MSASLPAAKPLGETTSDAVRRYARERTVLLTFMRCLPGGRRKRSTARKLLHGAEVFPCTSYRSVVDHLYWNVLLLQQRFTCNDDAPQNRSHKSNRCFSGSAEQRGDGRPTSRRPSMTRWWPPPGRSRAAGNRPTRPAASCAA